MTYTDEQLARVVKDVLAEEKRQKIEAERQRNRERHCVRVWQTAQRSITSTKRKVEKSRKLRETSILTELHCMDRELSDICASPTADIYSHQGQQRILAIIQKHEEIEDSIQ